jgi:hypothetical protein
MDECAGIGQEKVLMVLRLVEENLQKGQPICQNNTSVLVVKSQKSWIGEQIKELINQAVERRRDCFCCKSLFPFTIINKYYFYLK